MSEMKHTPGPWGIESGYGFVITSDGSSIAAVFPETLRPGKNHLPAEANARLFAAAPELLGELVMCKQFLEDMHTQTVDWTIAESQVLHRAVSAVIAKATGGQP